MDEPLQVTTLSNHNSHSFSNKTLFQDNLPIKFKILITPKDNNIMSYIQTMMNLLIINFYLSVCVYIYRYKLHIILFLKVIPSNNRM